ncbi:MAG TPA: NADH-ubiquinone oxidoreductase-F iron-sulfur binding region domain-containing protein [Candidatus Dormibacteraeota bacterium]|nr:NADH-ubiquinone oxidoreductase-F iron-sulfur binding region domain-containing protein [Candidatus Dormibacteraeota bacterium]
MASPTLPRLFAGPSLRGGAEPYAAHVERLGRLPSIGSGAALIRELEASGLLGRGGAGFPVGRKWRSVAERAFGPGAVVLVNGAEGEPLSHKDRALLLLRPHLVLDGAELAAEAVGADEIILYVGERHAAAARAIEVAVAERARAERGRRHAGARAGIRLLLAPHGYVSGEESAAVHFANEADARPTLTPPRPYERGVGGLPTLVQNVESLAYVALIARHGASWYREPGRGETRGTTLVTVTGPDGRPLVHEIELGTTIGEVAGLGELRITQDETQAVLLGGYFGRWLDAGATWDTALDPASMRASGQSIGAGVVSFLSAQTCPVVATARIAEYMARQSAAQCGPCVFGLRSIAEAMIRIARVEARHDDLANLERWAAQVRNRGACRHPDGAVGLLTSALETFGAEVVAHERGRRCSFADGRSIVSAPLLQVA